MGVKEPNNEEPFRNSPLRAEYGLLTSIRWRDLRQFWCQSEESTGFPRGRPNRALLPVTPQEYSGLESFLRELPPATVRAGAWLVALLPFSCLCPLQFPVASFYLGCV